MQQDMLLTYNRAAGLKGTGVAGTGEEGAVSGGKGSRKKGRDNVTLFGNTVIITENHFLCNMSDTVFDVYFPCFGDISLSVSPSLSLSLSGMSS